MARGRRLRRWGLALWAVCLLGATSAHLGAPVQTVAAGAPPAAVGVVSQTSDAALLPARVAGELHAASQAAPLRTLVVAAVLALLVGLPAVLRRRHAVDGGGTQPLRNRRHTIALRAPPLQFA